MSRHTRLMLGITLLLVPTIVYGGLTVLGVVTDGMAGLPGPRTLSATQMTLYRAGHAHAGALMILSLVLQILVDHAVLPRALVWPVRIAAPGAAIVVSAGFFAVAHVPSAAIVLYLGALLVAGITVSLGIGLVRSRSNAP